MSEQIDARLARMAERALWAQCSYDAMERPHYVNDLPHLNAADGRVTRESYEWVAATDPATIARLCAVVAVAREEAAGQAANETPNVAAELPLVRALAALDATLGTSPDTQSSAPNLVNGRCSRCGQLALFVDHWCAQINRPTQADKARRCPDAVSFCGGPDRYGDTCAGCIETWTEEAKEKAK